MKNILFNFTVLFIFQDYIQSLNPLTPMSDHDRILPTILVQYQPDK